MFNVEILADSLSLQGDRLTTMKITFPRFILAELNTHRMFSRNSASSRAIPFKKMVQMVEENPFIPIAWQKDHKGMQGTEYLNEKETKGALQAWLEAKNDAVARAKYLNELGGVTKQLCNRLLEPFMWHTVICTASEFENFFKLRCPQYEDPSGKLFRSKKEYINHSEWKGCEEWSLLDWLGCNKSQAEIHIQAIAELMWDEFNSSTPKQLSSGQWHIPFGDNIDNETLGNILYPKIPLPHNIIDYDKEKVKIATARCARISYETLGDNPKIDYEADIRLHDRLLAEGHMSPFEHVARVMSDEEYDSYYNGKLSKGIEYYWPDDESQGWCRNFRGFIQYRSLIEKV